MRLSRLIVLLYLSMTALLPSYQGGGETVEVHFFAPFEVLSECSGHDQPEIEVPHERGHSHTLLHYMPGQRTGRISSTVNSGVMFIPETVFSVNNASTHYLQILPSLVIRTFVFAKKTSGLSPPLA